MQNICFEICYKKNVYQMLIKNKVCLYAVGLYILFLYIKYSVMRYNQTKKYNNEHVLPI